MQEITVYDSNGDTINNLVQWDKDVYVYIKEDIISGAYPVHFFNLDSDTAYAVSSTYSDGILSAKIPNVLLQSSTTIIGYVYEEGDIEQKSICRFKIPMRAKPIPSNYISEENKDFLNFEKVLDECSGFAKTAQSWAVGGTGTRAGEDTDNAKYYSQQSNNSSISANEAAEAAKASETNSKSSETKAKEYLNLMQEFSAFMSVEEYKALKAQG